MKKDGVSTGKWIAPNVSTCWHTYVIKFRVHMYEFRGNVLIVGKPFSGN